MDRIRNFQLSDDLIRFARLTGQEAITLGKALKVKGLVLIRMNQTNFSTGVSPPECCRRASIVRQS